MFLFLFICKFFLSSCLYLYQANFNWIQMHTNDSFHFRFSVFACFITIAFLSDSPLWVLLEHRTWFASCDLSKSLLIFYWCLTILWQRRWLVSPQYKSHTFTEQYTQHFLMLGRHFLALYVLKNIAVYFRFELLYLFYLTTLVYRR